MAAETTLTAQKRRQRPPVGRGPESRNLTIWEVAAILARGFLRLTEKWRTSAISSPRDVRFPLEVRRPESPHEVGDQPRRRP